MKKIILSALFVLQIVFVFGQSNAGFTGKVVDSKTQKPMQSVIVSVQNTNLTQLTDANGKFSFDKVEVGNQMVRIRTNGYKDQLLQVEITEGQLVDIGTVALEEDITTEQQLSLITITDNDLGDDNSGSENTASLLMASRDAFIQAAAFNWGQARFKVRGLDNAYGTVMINGIVMNKIYDDRPQYSNWGGLNDALRNQEFTIGSNPSDYTFGGILGTNEINTRASTYRKGNRISVAGTNTNYTGRIMGTVASGMRNDGWAYTISASRRYANEGYFEGTTYSANSLYASIEKKINDKHSLNFTSMYGQNNRGKNSPNTQEVTDLQGEKYNSYWGYQDGRKRNSRVKTVEEPLFMLTDYWKISPKTNLNTTVFYQFGKIGNSRIDFQGANNPDPTYYRNMPSYFGSLYENDIATVTLLDPSAYLPGGLGGINYNNNYDNHNNPNNPFDIPYINAHNGVTTAAFLSSNQLDWQSLYIANEQANINGEGAKYILYEDRTDDKQFTANVVFNTQLADNIILNAGGTFSKVKSHNFKNLLDLLGANYFNDVNLFGYGDQRQSDLNNPSRTVKIGDNFGYNYNLNTNKIDAFTQFKFTYKKVDFYVAQTFSRLEYQREGLYKNGYYPINSFGKSEKLAYDNFGFKGGLTYKITGRQYFAINGVYMSKAPSLRNVFSNARVNNNVTNGVSNETISSADASYIINAPKFKARLTAYFSKIQNQTETSFFFGDGAGIDDPTTDLNESNAFVAETVTDIDKRNIGLEFGFEYPITSTLKVLVSAAYGEYIYDNNPNVSLNIDNLATATNTKPVIDYGQAKLKNYKQSGMPQQAASIGLEYRDPKFWWIGANVNYLGANYIDVAPITRTDRFFIDPNSINGNSFPEATQERANELLKQEKFDNFNLINLSGGKSWKIKNQIVGLNVMINNLLDTTYKTGGYEQARNSNYRELNQDVSSGTPAFAPKYFYGYGRTYFLNLYLNF